MSTARGWTEADIIRREAVFDGLVTKAVRMSLRPLTANLRDVLTAAGDHLSQPAYGQANVVAATWQSYVGGELFPFLVQTFAESAEATNEAVSAAIDTPIPAVEYSYAAGYLSAATGRLYALGDAVWNQVRQQLAVGYDSGESINQLAARVRSITGATEVQALRLARTEVAAAANQGSLYQMLVAGFTDQECQKGWLATDDERTRLAHAVFLNPLYPGRWVGLLQPFEVGGEGLQCPGDPTGRPDNIINCRCTLEYRFHDDVLTAGFSHTFKKWISALHPRGDDGKFVEKGHAPGGKLGSPMPIFKPPIPAQHVPKKWLPTPKWQPSTPKPGAADFHVLPEHERGISGDALYAPGMYGRFGAAGVMVRARDQHGTEKFLVVRRQGGNAHGKWQLPGGALDQRETPEQGAARETFEELGTTPEQLTQLKRRGVHRVSIHVPGKDPWTYHNIAADAPTTFPVDRYDTHELSGAAWLTRQQLRTLKLHGALVKPFAEHLESVLSTFHTKPTTTASVEPRGDLQFRWVEDEHPRLPNGEFTEVGRAFDWLSNDDADAMHDKMTAYDPWTTRQRDALNAYAGSSYMPINMHLRGEDPQPEPRTKQQIDAIHAAMRPLPRDVKAHRIVYANVFEGVGSSADMKKMVGRTFEDGGFLSTTTDRNFYDWTVDLTENSSMVLLEFDVPAGTPAAYLGTDDGPGITAERELLLDHGTRFRITSVDQEANGRGVQRTVVRVEVLPRVDGAN